MEFAICEWETDVSDEAIEALRLQGVTALEPGPSFLDADETALESTGERFRAAGIRLYSAHAYFGGAYDLSLLEEDARKKTVAYHGMALTRAASAGISCLVVHPSGHLGTPREEARREAQLRASIETLLETAENTGVRLALENMPPTNLGRDSATIRGIVDDFDSLYLGVCFDIGHGHLVEEGVVTSFQGLRERIITFHLQDNDGHRDRHLQPPYGTLDWQAFIHEIQGFDFPFPMAVEAPPWNRAPWRALLREVRGLFSGELLRVPVGDRQVWVVCPECKHFLFGSLQDPLCVCDR